MQVSQENWISKRAYTLWENEGHPHGRDADHWAQAQKEYALLQSSKATKPAARKKAEKEVTLEETPKPKPRKKATA